MGILKTWIFRRMSSVIKKRLLGLATDSEEIKKCGFGCQHKRQYSDFLLFSENNIHLCRPYTARNKTFTRHWCAKRCTRQFAQLLQQQQQQASHFFPAESLWTHTCQKDSLCLQQQQHPLRAIASFFNRCVTRLWVRWYIRSIHSWLHTGLY